MQTIRLFGIVPRETLHTVSTCKDCGVFFIGVQVSTGKYVDWRDIYDLRVRAREFAEGTVKSRLKKNFRPETPEQVKRLLEEEKGNVTAVARRLGTEWHVLTLWMKKNLTCQPESVQSIP